MAISSRTRQTQLGRETVAGTAVAATARWTGLCTKEDGREVSIVEEAIGQYADRGTAYIASLGLQGLTMQPHPVSFEEILHILEAGVQTVSPTGTDPYTYSYALPGGTSDASIQSYTLEHGDSTQAEEIAYGFVQSFELKGTPNGAVMCSAKWQGRQWSSTTFTGSLSLPSVEVVLFNKGALYLDDSGGTIGTTQISNSFVEFTLGVDTGLRAVQTAEGELYYSTVKRVKPAVTLSITAEHDTNWDSDSEVADFRAKTIRLARIQFTGTSSRSLTIDIAGLWKSFTWGDRDGNSIVSGTLEAINSSTDSLFAEFEVINGLSAVP